MMISDDFWWFTYRCEDALTEMELPHKSGEIGIHLS
jgi:hypothetical protein